MKEKVTSITQKAKYLFWCNVPYRVDVTDFSYIHLFFSCGIQLLVVNYNQSGGGAVVLKFIKSLLARFKPSETVWKPDRPKPAWPEIVDLMYG